MRSRIMIRALMGVAAVALIAACSQPGEEGTIRVGMASNSAGWIPVFIAIEEGFFEDEGLQVDEPVQLGSGANAASALAAGSIDVSLGIAPDVANLHSNGQDVRLLGAIYNAYSVDIVVGNDFEGDLDASLEDKIRALEGLTIGITGPSSGTEALVIYLFELVGLDPETDVELVGLGGDPSAALNALQTGQVDALSHVLSVGEQAEDLEIGTLYISPGRGDVPDLDGVAHGTLYTMQNIVDARSDELERFLRGYQRAMQFFTENPERSKEILQDYLSGMSPAVIDELMSVLSQGIPSVLEVDPTAWELEVDMLRSTGLIEDDLPPLADLTVPELLPDE